MKIKINNNKLIVELPFEIIVKNAENDEYVPLKITNESKMVKWMQDNHETQLKFERCVNEILLDAYEHAEAWVEGNNVDTNKE